MSRIAAGVAAFWLTVGTLATIAAESPPTERGTIIGCAARARR